MSERASRTEALEGHHGNIISSSWRAPCEARAGLIEHGGRRRRVSREPHGRQCCRQAGRPSAGIGGELCREACDSAPQCLMFKLGSLGEPGCRVPGLPAGDRAVGWVVGRGASSRRPTHIGITESPGHPAGVPCNGQLLGLAWEPLAALRIATDFFNWDLEAHGQAWRLSVHDAPAAEEQSTVGSRAVVSRSPQSESAVPCRRSEVVSSIVDGPSRQSATVQSTGRVVRQAIVESAVPSCRAVVSNQPVRLSFGLRTGDSATADSD